MKKSTLVFTVVSLMVLVSCKNAASDEAKLDATNLSMYVDSVQNLTPVYTVENWAALDNAYQERALKAEKNTAALEAADKEKLEASKAKYATLKATYEAKLKEQETNSNMKVATSEAALEAEKNKNAAIVSTPDYRMTLRNNLFGEGKIGTDIQFGFVTAGNILGVYKNFVNTVADNKNNYTREDWDEIKVLYEALDTRKNVVEKDLSGPDNREIAGLKIRFATIKATHRFATKATENNDAKK